MNKILLTTVLFFYIFYGKAQTVTPGNKDHQISFFSYFLNKIDTPKLKEGDFQIRMWFNDGGMRTNKTFFVLFTKLTGVWYVSNYIFIKFPYKNDSIIVQKQVPVKLNYDSLYKQLLVDGLLSLKYDTLQDPTNRLFEKYGIIWADSGPTKYFVQVVTKQNRWTVNYKCPKYFYIEAKMEEFKTPLKIISSLLKLIGLAPC